MLDSSPNQRAIFLDRDGTINEDPGYLSDPSQLKLFPGVANALARLKKAGYLLIVVSNQSGVARGLIDPKMLPQIHAQLDQLLEPSGARIDSYQLCLHHPNDHCACRKPEPKLLLDSAQEFNIDLKKSYMVGDKFSDVEVGVRAGCRGSILVRTGEGRNAESQLQPRQVLFIADSLPEAADWILNPETASS